MSQVAATYVRRHLLIPVNSTKGLILVTLAVVGDDAGRVTRYTQAMLATDTGKVLSTVKKSMQALLRDGMIRKVPIRSYVIAGVAEHDINVCPHVECAAEAASVREGRGSLTQRERAAARARRYREKQKRERNREGH